MRTPRFQIEKGLLFACCLALLLSQLDAGNGVAILLVAVIVSGLLSLLAQPVLRTVLTVGYALLCCVVPELTYFVPLIAFDMPGQRYAAANLFSIVPMVLFFSSAPLPAAMAVGVLVVPALLLRVRREELAVLRVESLRLRDTNREVQERLKQRNHELMDRQDTDVRAATLDERNRIAREIHDSVGHLLASALLQIGALLVTTRDGTAGKGLQTLNDTLTQAMNSIRRSVHDLRDDSIVLHARLHTLTESFTFCRLRLDNQWSGDPGMPVKTAVIAVCREALANIMRHSNATEAVIVMREHPAFRQLIIRDNGTVKTYRSGEGMGLSNMEERIRALGGQFRISTEQGFEIFITIPKEEKPNQYQLLPEHKEVGDACPRGG